MTPTQQDASRISRQAGARRRFPRNRVGILFFSSGLFPCFFPALMLFFQLVSPRTGWTVEEDDNGVEELFMGTTLELPDWLRTPDGYVFRPEGKPDPFRPFVRPAPPEESFRAQAPARALTPLERVEATQLRVIGIVWAVDRPDQALAMVEMPDGKGFVLRPGVGVGRYGGKVRRITANEVIIEEHGLDIAGREQVREVILKLHPSEGDDHG
ncbi:Tfp pilus assembly protein PilP [Desulfonatronum zhilinae]|nr:Tfp pilus assembly protein PilP [Desulfonatronum zhilinae]